jgi:hypothetical protein
MEQLCRWRRRDGIGASGAKPKREPPQPTTFGIHSCSATSTGGNAMAKIQLAIRPAEASGLFRVEAESELGEAAVKVKLDITSLLQLRAELEQTVLAAVAPDSANDRLQEIGRTLFAALLGPQAITELYRATVAVAERLEERLRVIVSLDTPALVQLPWELMYDPLTREYLCLRYQLVRRVPAQSAAILQVRLPLQILGIVSSPQDQAPLDVKYEQQQLAQALAEPCADGRIQLHWAGEATWQALHDRLLDGPWHVLHFIGHGAFDVRRDMGILAFTGADGSTHPVHADQLLGLLGQANPRPSLVVLNSCSGAASGATDVFTGTASALVRGGVSAVAAMQYSITNRAASAFAEGFYNAIAHGRGVDQAVSSGRVAILGARRLEWVTPVLYLRGDRTQLFDLQAPLPNDLPSPSGAEDQPTPGPPQSADPAQASDAGSPIHGISWDPDGSRIAVATEREVLGVVDIDGKQPKDHPLAITDRRKMSLMGDSPWIVDVAFSPLGDRLATASSYAPWEVDGTHIRRNVGAVKLWDAATGRELFEIGANVMASTVAFSPDGMRVATAGLDNNARIWDASEANREPALPLRHDGKVSAVAFSPVGTRVATGGADESARIWNSRTGQQLLTFPHGGPVSAVAFNDDGTRLATSGPDNIARIWNAANRKWLLDLPHDDGLVNTVAFSSDGSRVVTGGTDNTAWIWDAATGHRLLRLPHEAAVTAAVFAADGAHIATASADKTVLIWDLAGL